MPSKNVREFFSQKFNILLDDITGKKVAYDLCVSESSITAWKKKDANPSIESLCMICNYFKVTPNYLLGYTNKERRKEYRNEFRAFTGLSDVAINNLHKKSSNKRLMHALNYLLTDDDLLDSLADYLLQDFYAAFHSDPQYKLLPKKHFYTSEKEFLFVLITTLAHTKDKFTEHVKCSSAIHTEIKLEMWDQEVNRDLCEVLTATPLIEMDPTESINDALPELLNATAQILDDSISSSGNQESQNSSFSSPIFPSDSSIQGINSDGTLIFKTPLKEQSKIDAMRQYLQENDTYRKHRDET